MCKIKLKYNYSTSNDFSSRTPSKTYPTQNSLGQMSNIIFLEKEKTEEDNKNNSRVFPFGYNPGICIK
jgi:hypothetical protein